MKRSRSIAAFAASPSSSCGLSRLSFPQTAPGTSSKKMRRSDSDESVITILDSDDETNDKENQVPPPHKQQPKTKSGLIPVSGLKVNQLLDPKFMQSVRDSQPKSASHHLQNLPGTSFGSASVQSKPSGPEREHAFGQLNISGLKINQLLDPKFMRSFRDSRSQSTLEDAQSKPGYPKQTSKCELTSNGWHRKRRISGGSSTSDESIDEFEGGVEEMSEPEDERDPTAEPSSASQHDFSLADYDTLLSCCSKPRNRLRVQHKSRTLDNAAFFELLMSVRAIDLCISRMYIVNSKIPQAKQSLVDLQERLFGKTGKINLSQLTKCVLMDTRDHLKLSERDAKAANLYLDLVKYLIEIFVYMETLAFLRFRVFDMKLQELYEASSGNLPAYLAMIFKLKQPMQQNQMDRESYKDLNLEQLNELKRVRNDVTNREYLKKHDLAARLLDRQITGSEETDALVDQLQSVEHLNQLDPTGKVQIIKQLVDLIMFDGITYRAFVNDLRFESNRQLQALKAENDRLKEIEAKYEFSRPVEVDKDESDDHQEDSADRRQDEDKSGDMEIEPAGAVEAPELTKLRPNTRKMYLRELSKYRKLEKTFHETKSLLRCIVRSEPVCSISATTDSDIRRLNLWSFENLMPNYLIAEGTKQEFASEQSETSWFQISDVNEFTRSLKALLPAAEFNQINRSISKLNTGHRKPEANTGLDATAPVSQDFLSRLTEFQASRKPKGAIDQSNELSADEDDHDDECQVSDSTQNAESLVHADRIYQSLLDLYDCLFFSNLHRWMATNGQLEGERVERYEMQIGEESAQLTEEWPNLVSKLERARSRADRTGLDPATKDRLLLVMSVMCQTLLDSLDQNTKALPFKFFRELNLGAVLHDYVLVNCSSFQFLDLFITVLKNNIQWEHSLENTDCQICQETRIKDGSLTDNTKIQCSYCNAYFHYGCLTYEEDESKITFFTYGKLPKCSICLISEEKQLMKSLEVESVDVNDYKLRAQRVRGGYLMQERELDNEIDKRCRILSDKPRPRKMNQSSSSSSAGSSDESWSSVNHSHSTRSAMPSASRGLRTRKPVNYQDQLAEPKESDSDE